VDGAEFFKRLGFLIVEDFVEAPLLTDLLGDLKSATSRQAEFYQVESGWKVNEEIRRAKWLEPSTAIRTRLNEQLQALKPRIEDHFHLSLEAFEELQFLRYEAGDYILLHVDTQGGAEGELGQRKVSVIIYFNQQSDDGAPGSYAGGSFVFGMPNKAVGRMMSLPLAVRAGLLVAFPSTIPHEVRPIAHGVRYSAVTWFR
jgi:SM-20-related protein